MTRLAVLALVALTVACSDRPKPPPEATGAWFQVNPARWAAAQPVTSAHRPRP